MAEHADRLAALEARVPRDPAARTRSTDQTDGGSTVMMNLWRRWQLLVAWWRRWPSWLRRLDDRRAGPRRVVVLLATLQLLDQVRLWLDHGPTPDLWVYLHTLSDAGVLFVAALVTAVHRRLRRRRPPTTMPG